MRLLWTREALADYQYWEKHDQKVLASINALIGDIRHNDPFRGLGKPEPLKHGTLKGWWSRRITREHRLVYRVSGKGAAQQLEIAACRFHY
jgi:toxin YoeB